VTVTGGTHNPWAPPFDFLAETFLPAVAQAGFHAECELIKHGFFPAGGGKIRFTIRQLRRQSSRAIDLCEPPTEPEVHARIYTARLPDHIAHRQQELLCQSGLRIADMEHIDAEDSDGPGNCSMLRICSDDRTTVFTAFGQKGKPSKKVIAEVAAETRHYLSSGAAVNHYLADQLLIYMALTRSGSFTTNEVSTHLTTNIETIKKFLTINFNIEHGAGKYSICCHPI
jgi:RNA 3'-terminal phosphate cyclase (ATP)